MSDTTDETAKPVERKPVRNFLLLAPPIDKPGGRKRCEIWITSDMGRRARRMNIRLWIEDPSGEMRPTSRGLAFGMDKAQALRDALILACERAGLTDDE